MATFENPDFPVQPCKGVYAWYAHKNGQKPIVIYVGMAGKKKSIIRKGTLFRGISELQRNTFTSNSPDYNALDTDFIVGTTILFFEREGFSCTWKHIGNEPADEIQFVKDMKPILQDVNATIREEYRIRKVEKDYWKNRKTEQGIAEAENEIFSILKKNNC